MVPDLPDSWSNWNLEMLVFEKRGEPEYLEKNLSEQRREPTTNSTHIWHRCQDLSPGHIGGRQALSPLCPPPPLAPCYCCNCTVLKVWINHKARTFSWLCHNHRSRLLGVLSLFADWNDRFPYLLINFKLWRASCMGYYREYSPGIC